MAELRYACKSKEIAQEVLKKKYENFTNKAAEEIQKASSNGLLKTTVYYDKTMDTDAKTYIVLKLENLGYGVNARYTSQYNEASYHFEISWEKA